MHLKPNSVLDVGAGFGKYGVLCREFLELWDGRDKYDFIRRIDAVEVYEKYITPLHNFIYNKIYVDDIKNAVNREFYYDIVLLIDVLEHFPKQDGYDIITKVLQKNRGILISTPKNVSHQEDDFENVYETHRSQWSRDDLEKLGNVFFARDSSSFIVYVGSKDDVNSLNRKYPYSRKGKIKAYYKDAKRKLASKPHIYKTYKFVKDIFGARSQQLEAKSP